MTYQGIVQHGAIVLSPGVHLPEGATVRLELVETDATREQTEDGRTLREKLLELAGTIDGLPEDLSMNHDRCLWLSEAM
jgi:hypothetical protein